MEKETPSIRVQRLSTLEEFSELGEQWDLVQRRCSTKHVLLDHRWLNAWLRATRDPARELHVLVLRRDSEVAGLVPLILTRGWEVFPSRRLQIHTVDDYRYRRVPRLARLTPVRRLSFPLSVAIATRRAHFLFVDDDPALYRATVGYIESISRKWDLLALEGLPTESQQPRLVHEAIASSSLRGDGRSFERETGFASLPKSFDEFLAGKSSHFRKRMRQQCRQAETRFPDLRVREFRGDAINDGIERVLALEELSWKASSERKRDFYIGPEKRLQEFYRTVAREFAKTDEASVLTMEIGDRPIAGIFCVERERVLAAIITYMDEEYVRRLTAAPMFKSLVERAIERGIEEIDFNGSTTLVAKWSEGWHAATRLFFYNRRPYSRALRRLSVSARQTQKLVDSIRNRK